MKGLLGICVLVAIASSTSDMTLEEKRVENAIFAMVGEQPPHDVPLDQRDSLHDKLVSRQKAAKAVDPKNHSDHSAHEHHKAHEGHEAHMHHEGHKSDVSEKGHMDHAHMSHTGHENHEGHTMMMYFHGGSKEVILFDFWRIESCTGLLISCVIVFVMGAMYEGLKWFRVYLTLFKKEKEPETLPSNVTETHCKSRTENNNAANVPLVNAGSRSSTPEAKHPGPFSPMRLSQALLYIVQLVVAYWLMLIVMTYNIWLTIAVILGAGFGHWLFAALRFANPDGEAADQIATDACH